MKPKNGEPANEARMESRMGHTNWRMSIWALIPSPTDGAATAAATGAPAGAASARCWTRTSVANTRAMAATAEPTRHAGLRPTAGAMANVALSMISPFPRRSRRLDDLVIVDHFEQQHHPSHPDVSANLDNVPQRDWERTLTAPSARRRRLAIGVVAGAALALVGGFTMVQVLQAASAGQRGRAALARAEAGLSAGDVAGARQDLASAQRAFTRTSEEMRALGPVAGVARVVPLLGTQVRAADTFADAGSNLSEAGQRLVDVADAILNPADQAVPVSAALDALRSTQRSMAPVVAAIARTSDEVARLEARFLIGPLARARDDLATRLPRIQARATAAEQGLSALMAFAGEQGPRRYLFLSQNPDEVRPTGGFIGTYGVLSADAGRLQLERYDAIESWTGNRPSAEVPPEQVGSPFRYHNPPLRRTLGNVNSTPDWPQVAQLAARLWQAGGEAPVDGVISFTPAFLGRVLSVVGPVTVASYGETVTAANLNERLDLYTQETTPPPGADRKDFVAALAETVMRRLLDAPARQWEPLGRAMGKAFSAREALAWSSDPQVATALAERGWDGAFPAHDGDFFYNSEFQYAAKNGRGIRRVYDHTVALGADGAARVTTTITITNTEAPGPANASTLAYLTIYGPEGGVLDQAASDPFSFREPPLAGHPAAGWFRAAPPAGGQTTLKVVWDVPALARQQRDGSWEYSLRWMGLPDHTGDVVNLRVELPATWRWKGAAPPGQFSLDRDMRGTWPLVAGD